MEIKYTNDGKKVAVIGNLNKQEKIVQEIFIVNGQEIPSGENFTVTSLHDAPAISWREKDLKAKKDALKTLKTKIDDKKNEYLKAQKELTTKISATKDLIKHSTKVIDNIKPDDLELLNDCLSKNITHYVVLDYHPRIVDYLTANLDVDNYGGFVRYEGLKVLTLLADPEKGVGYRLSQYRDGSGSWTNVVPCRSYEEAVVKLKDYILSKDNYNSYDIEEAEKHNIQLNVEKLIAFHKKAIKSTVERIETDEKNIKQNRDKVKEVENIIDSLKGGSTNG